MSESLTPAETRVLERIAQGSKSHEDTAAALGVKRSTVITHANSARAKLQATTTAHAVYIALKRGLIQ